MFNVVFNTSVFKSEKYKYSQTTKAIIAKITLLSKENILDMI